jgi:hypothetical protein
MSTPTTSERLFEQLCNTRGIVPRRIPPGQSKAADFEVDIDSTTLVVEVKELERKVNNDFGVTEAENEDGVVAPSDWVRKQIGDSYEQLKNSACGTRPTLLVLFNNAGLLHWLDSSCISRGMFGAMGIRLALSEGEIAVARQGFFGGRKVTKDSCRSLSAVAVMQTSSGGEIVMDAYHNPFAAVPINPKVLAKLASAQLVHPAPHEGAVVSWSPVRLET